MDTNLQEKPRKVTKVEEEDRVKVEAAKQEKLPVTAPASPPSSSSSPSHEFSFTISLHSSCQSVPDFNKNSKSTPSSFAIDLSPADDIFFHGHLLPLQFLSHLPVSARSSTNSMDSYTLPIKDSFDEDRKPIQESSKNGNISSKKNSIKNKTNSCSCINQRSPSQGNKNEARGRVKSKSFSIFWLPKWRKDCENIEKEDKEEMKHKRKMRFDVSHILKRYVTMVRPLLLFRGRKEKGKFGRENYSFSGNLRLRNNNHELRGRMGEYFSSAPASMRTSPTNSGLLVATSEGSNVSSSASDSTVEELQAAIQAAIAHCKNSISAEEKLKC